MATYSYTLDLAALTVIRTTQHGEAFDLNAGAPCESTDDLRALAVELYEQGFYSATVRDDLLAALPTVDLLVYGQGGDDDTRITLRANPDGWRWMDADGNDTEVSANSAVQALGAAIAAWGTSGLHGVSEAFEVIASGGRA